MLEAQKELGKAVLKAAVKRALGPLGYERVQFRRRVGYWPNLRAPRSFNEKICHRKHFEAMPQAPTLADKWKVRELVAERVGSEILNEVYFVGNNPEKIDFDALPDAFILKGNNGSGPNYLRIVRDKAGVGEDALVDAAGSILKRRESWHKSFYHFTNEWWYHEIKPLILIEAFLKDDRYESLLDYKFFVFHGVVHYIQVDFDRFSNHTRTLYDREWRRQPFSLAFPLGPDAERPPKLGQMIEIAERIAVGFDFIRVDLYCVNDDRITFGEITLSPGMGWEPFTPREFDYALGGLW